MTAPLEAHALGKRFRRTWALRDCTLSVPERAIVGLAGPNGAGKSTLLGLATSLLVPSEGSVEVLGRDPRRDPSVIAEIGYVAQGAPLYRSFTVRETVAFAAKTNARWDRTVAGEFLEGLDGGAKVSSLSASDRVRLALALALGKRPVLLLVDEPFARLDPLSRREFLRLLMDGVAETEATVIVASHISTEFSGDAS